MYLTTRKLFRRTTPLDIIPFINEAISKIDPSYVIIIVTIFMIIFAIKDYSTYKNEKHVDYKSIIVSLGVLGTFVGILIGLADFNTSDIKGSIPLLLDGLKTSFVTSVEGMIISVFLSVIQKSSGKGTTEDELSALKNIELRLASLESIDKKMDSLKKLDDMHQVSALMNTKLDSIDTNFKNLSNDINSIKEHMTHSQNQLFEFLQENLENIKTSLEDAVEKLAEGASKEIINALNEVIKDFNNNLIEQFGDNFKQLNESVKNMIIWQENYKNTIENLEKTLNQAVKSISTTDEKLDNMAESYNKIEITHKKLQDIIETNNHQVNDLEIHLKTLGKVGEKAQLSVEAIDEFSDKIQKSLTGQSESLHKLTEDINKQLPEALDELNKALTTLTNKFKNDYDYFLQQVSKLMVSMNKS